MSSIVVLSIVFITIVYGLVKKVDIFNCFIEGGKEGLRICINLAPTIIGLVVAITMFTSSGAVELLTAMLKPISKITGIPAELFPLAIIRPISGSGALAMFENILKEYGGNSQVATMASVLMGSTETTFYAATVYFSSININKTMYTIPCALFADFAGLVFAVFTVRLFFA